MKIAPIFVATLGLSLLLGGCTADDPLAVKSNEQNFVSADGTITEIPSANRGPAADFESSNTTTGEKVSSTELRGSVVVVNFWFAACPPCRLEAPDLAELATMYSDRGVTFFGVNVYDGKASAQSFEKTFSIPYPSVLDAEVGSLRLAFADDMPPTGVPTTLILDRQGRVAARVSGAITDRATFETMLDTVVAEAAP